MAGKTITTAERRHRDYLRRRGLAVGAVYEKRLIAARRKEIRSVLAKARDYDDPAMVAPTISKWLDESGYLGKWWQGLYIAAGVPMAKSTANDLRKAKAAEETDIWTRTLWQYATRRAGENIVLVTGTLKDTLIGIVADILLGEPSIGVEALTTQIYKRYTGKFERWMARRIAQTETMIGMAQAADAAAQTLDVAYVKQWAISGLGNTRETHELMDGKIVDQNEPFILPDCQMMFPHDTSRNAPASEIINCACDCIRRPKNTGASLQDASATGFTENTPPPSIPASNVAATEEGYSDILRKNILAKENTIRKNRDESACIFDPDKGTLVSIIGGKGATVDVSKGGGFPKDSIVTHNHPRALGKTGLASIGSSFSLADLDSALTYDISEIRAVTPKYTFSMRRPDTGWGVSRATLRSVYDVENRRLTNEFNAYINAASNETERARRVTRAQVMHYHELSKRIAKKFGWIYLKKNS